MFYFMRSVLHTVFYFLTLCVAIQLWLNLYFQNKNITDNDSELINFEKQKFRICIFRFLLDDLDHKSHTTTELMFKFGRQDFPRQVLSITPLTLNFLS